MNPQLYSDALKALARSGGTASLEAPTARAMRDNPLCGDRVRMEVAVTEGRITALAHHTRGCLICEAAAAMLTRHAPGQKAADIAVAREALLALLRGEEPALPWPELNLFRPLATHRSRHGCALLPFAALEAALEGKSGTRAPEGTRR